MLYNEKQKQNYFDAVDIFSPIKQYFLKTEPIERKLDKDLCQWNISEILSFYKSLCSASNFYLLTLNTQYKLYTNWCISEGLVNDGMNHFNEIDCATINSCLNTLLVGAKIISREKLLEEISEFENDVDKFICLAIFEGISGKNLEDLINVRTGDFNQDTKTIIFGKKVIKYSSELYNFAIKAAEEKYYYKPEEHKNKYVLSGDPDRIIKKLKSHGKQDDVVRTRNMLDRLSRLNNLYGKVHFSSKALHESGRIDTIKKLMSENKYTNLMDALYDEYIVNVYGFINSRGFYIDKYKEYLK